MARLRSPEWMFPLARPHPGQRRLSSRWVPTDDRMYLTTGSLLAFDGLLNHSNRHRGCLSSFLSTDYGTVTRWTRQQDGHDSKMDRTARWTGRRPGAGAALPAGDAAKNRAAPLRNTRPPGASGSQTTDIPTVFVYNRKRRRDRLRPGVVRARRRLCAYRGARCAPQDKAHAGGSTYLTKVELSINFGGSYLQGRGSFADVRSQAFMA